MSPFWNLGINIFLPVAILNWSGKWQVENAAELGLILGLIPPIGYGVWDWVKNNNRNGVSLLGIINVLFTGGLALLTLKPYWFVIKEAFFPFILGAAVLISEKTGAQAFFEKMLRQSEGFRWDRIDAQAESLNRKPELKDLMKSCNRLFALSFFISSALNYLLADRVFRGIPDDLDMAQQKLLLNEQIAEMMWKGWLVIALPLMLFMMFVFWFFFTRIKKITELDLEDIAKS